MPTVTDIAQWLDELAPGRLAEDWDNVGLLVGDGGQTVRRLMTCLTVTPASATEAVREGVDLIVTHHPLPFRPLKRLTTDDPTGRLLLALIAAGVSVHSSHTAFDSAAEGINFRLANGLGLRDIEPLVPDRDDAQLGTGRVGCASEGSTLGELAGRVKDFLAVEVVQMVGDPTQPVRRVAVGCGAAGELLAAARLQRCDTMLLGETRFHTCLEAEATGVGLVMPGHYASERFAVECLAEALADRFPEITAWASRDERDPIRYG